MGAGLDGVTGPGAGKLMPAPYVNMVFVEGAVLLPLTGEEGEDEMHREIGELVGREPVGLPTELSAFGGGGLGCITQQVGRAGRTCSVADRGDAPAQSGPRSRAASPV